MNYIYLNDLQENYPDKSLLEINDILVAQHTNLHLIKIKTICRICGCEVIVSPSIYRKQKTFACDEHKIKRPSGEDSQFYKRISIKCTNCDKPIKIIESELKKRNQFGDSHHFCSQRCYWDFRKKYYIHERGAMYKHQYTEEQKENLSMGCVKRTKSSDRLNTKVQLAVNQILNDMGIRYEREHIIKYYSCDNYLTDYNLIIEVMGDYWHANPNIYNALGRKINLIQYKTIVKDKQKKSYIINHTDCKVLYLWESDVFKNTEKCAELIQLFIDNRGILDNYNSFNYYMIDNQLVLNNDIIHSYNELPKEKYINLLQS